MTRVIDASCVLALIRREPGCEVLASLLPGSRISTVNIAEVAGRLADLGLESARIREIVVELDLTEEPFGLEDALAAGGMRTATRALGLSLGDRACLALARRLGAPAYTADRAWRDIDVGVEVILVR